MMTEYYNIFALLDENDVVQDIVLLPDIDVANNIARQTYISGKAINVNKFNVHVGDFYKNHTFYKCVNPNDYEFGIEVDSTIPLEEELDNLLNIIGQRDQQIEYLENIITENGLDKLIS